MEASTIITIIITIMVHISCRHHPHRRHLRRLHLRRRRTDIAGGNEERTSADEVVSPALLFARGYVAER